MKILLNYIHAYILPICIAGIYVNTELISVICYRIIIVILMKIKIKIIKQIPNRSFLYTYILQLDIQYFIQYYPFMIIHCHRISLQQICFAINYTKCITAIKTAKCFKSFILKTSCIATSIRVSSCSQTLTQNQTPIDSFHYYTMRSSSSQLILSWVICFKSASWR